MGKGEETPKARIRRIARSRGKKMASAMQEIMGKDLNSRKEGRQSRVPRNSGYAHRHV